MRGPLALMALVVIAGCQDEPSFDERYDRTEKQIRAKAAQIDRELGPAPVESTGDPER